MFIWCHELRIAKRARLLFFIFKFSKCSCHPLFVLLINFKQRIRKRNKKIAKKRLRKEGTHGMGEDSNFSAGFFEDKIKALQVRHTFENDYFDVVLGNVRKI